MTSGIHDISVRLGPGTVPWPGMSPVAERSVFADVARGDAVTGSSWSLNSHVGTHVDAPTHFLPDGKDIASTPLDRYLGRCVVLDLTDVEGRDVERADLEGRPELDGHTRMLMKTSNCRRLWHLDTFDSDYVALAHSGAQWLVERGFRLAGIDYQGIERFDTTTNPTHKTLLGAECAILEGADLREVEPGEYVLIALPLALEDGEASPVRALLVEPGALAAVLEIGSP
jgi:arylformamidase